MRISDVSSDVCSSDLHANKVVPGLLGPYHRLHGIHGRHIPHLAVSIHSGKRIIKTRLPTLQPVYDTDPELGIHEADFGSRPGRDFVRISAPPHIQISLSITLSQNYRKLGYGH